MRALSITSFQFATALMLCLVGTTRASAQCTDALASPRTSHAAAGAGGKILVGGGVPSAIVGSTVDVFDTQTGLWSTENLSFGRSALVATSVDDLVLFAGGGNSSPNFSFNHTDVVDVYDTSTGTWNVEHLSVPRSIMGVASVAGIVVFAGGWVSPTPPLGPTDVVDLWDTTTGTWSSTTLSAARYLPGTARAGDKLVVAGGHMSYGPTDAVDIFDSTTQLWSTDTLQEPRGEMGATSVGNLALFAGGSDAVGAVSDLVEIYDGETGTWSTAQLSVARRRPRAATVGRLAVFAGGDDDNFDPLDVVDVFDAQTGLWFTWSMSEPRTGVAVAAAGTTLLVAGGLDAAGAVSGAVELFRTGHPRPFGVGSSGCPCGNDSMVLSGCGNSTGLGATLLGSGCPAVTAGDLTIEASGLVPGQATVLFSGQASASPLPFGDGQVWLQSPNAVALSLADATGAASWQSRVAALALPGQRVDFQVWYRDPAGPCGGGSNLTNGLQLVYEP